MQRITRNFHDSVQLPRQNSTPHPAIGAGGPDRLTADLQPDPAIQHASPMDIDRFGGVLDTLPGYEAVVMFVDRGGHDPLPPEISNESTREHIDLAGGVEVIKRVHGFAEAEYRNLMSLDESTHTCPRNHVFQRTYAGPTFVGTVPALSNHATAPVRRWRRSSRVAGRICPLSSTNSTFESVASLLTKWR